MGRGSRSAGDDGLCPRGGLLQLAFAPLDWGFGCVLHPPALRWAPRGVWGSENPPGWSPSSRGAAFPPHFCPKIGSKPVQIPTPAWLCLQTASCLLLGSWVKVEVRFSTLGVPASARVFLGGRNPRILALVIIGVFWARWLLVGTGKSSRDVHGPLAPWAVCQPLCTLWESLWATHVSHVATRAGWCSRGCVAQRGPSGRVGLGRGGRRGRWGMLKVPRVSAAPPQMSSLSGFGRRRG